MSAVELEAILRGERGSTPEQQRLAEVVALLRTELPSAPERLRARVARVAETAPPQRFRFAPPRRALLVVVAAALAVAVFAAIVHGLVGSSGSNKTTHSAAKAPLPAWERATTVRAAPHRRLGAGAVGGSPGAPYSASTQQSLDRMASPALTGGQRLQHVDASLRIRVASVDKLSQATSDATRVARSLGGYALSVNYRTPAGKPGQAFLELRVPTTKVQQAIARLSGLGTLVSQQLSVQDLQRDLDRENAQILHLREAVAAYEAALKDASLTPVQRIELQLKLADTKRALAQRSHKRGATLAEGALSRVSLVLTTAQPVHAATHHSSGLGRRLHSAVGFLGLEGTILLYALIVVSPFAVLGALAWAATRLRRRREEDRLLAA
jgi:hypothetical protein